MEFTKGEWKHVEDGVIITEDGRQIAAVFPRDRMANAHLIAAAPDMYEALKLMAERLKEIEFKYPITLELPRVWIDKALAKAEGE